MDKRNLSDLFRERLKILLQRSDLNQSAFAAAVGIDRSALSQLLSGASTRLPRAETLLNIAAEHKVSLDWLLGLSQDEGLTGEIRESLEIEEGSNDRNHTLLARWHAEAAGTKIRYVPAGIPDLLRTEALIDYEADISNRSREQQADETQYRIEYNRRPGDRHGGLHAAPYARHLRARAGRVDRVSRARTARAASPHGGPARRSLSDLPPVPL